VTNHYSPIAVPILSMPPRDLQRQGSTWRQCRHQRIAFLWSVVACYHFVLRRVCSPRAVPAPRRRSKLRRGKR